MLIACYVFEKSNRILDFGVMIKHFSSILLAPMFKKEQFKCVHRKKKQFAECLKITMWSIPFHLQVAVSTQPSCIVDCVCLVPSVNSCERYLGCHLNIKKILGNRNATTRRL